MRTREIEFWVEPEDIDKLTTKYDSTSVLRLYVHRDSVSKNGQLIKLIQPIPEKKIEISESEFDEFVKDIGNPYSGYTLREGSILCSLRSKLFGGETN